ncbi:MAG: hypothetical protein JWP97_5395 [Labilithrix sp.]|nr:hypothetical protein [Labilithrix sp.]
MTGEQIDRARREHTRTLCSWLFVMAVAGASRETLRETLVAAEWWALHERAQSTDPRAARRAVYGLGVAVRAIARVAMTFRTDVENAPAERRLDA